MTVRLYAILARDADRAIVFRRGPSKRVLVIRWNTADDTFEEGQWFKGRIYERRCDLSPDGELLVYFAANYRKPYFSWSAISRPPFLTALALWPKGDAWGGGGQFKSSNHLLLNHRANEMQLAEDFSLSKRLKVDPFGKHSGWGEDNPAWSERLERDGWILVAAGSIVKADFDAKVKIEFDPPVTWEKVHPIWPHRYTLRMSIGGLNERDGPWYLIDHAVIDDDGSEVVKLGRSDWADWSDSGDLLFALSGRLHRLRRTSKNLPALGEAITLADFSDRKFRELKAPPEALCWPKAR